MTVTLVSTPDDGTCGIGTYTGELLEAFEADYPVNHVAFPSGTANPLPVIRSALRAGAAPGEVVHLQHEYGILGPMSLFSWLFLPLLYLTSKLAHKRVLVTLHSAWHPDMVDDDSPLRGLKRLYLTANNQLLARTADQLIFLSEFSQDSFAQTAPVDGALVLPHGVPTRDTVRLGADVARDRFGYEADDVVIVEPGYLRREKGCHVFVELAARLPAYEFFLAGGAQGDGAYQAELESRAPDNVQISGILDDRDFHAAFQAADLVVLPYLEMTQSGIFNWCAAYAVPVAASDHPTFRRIEREWGCLALFDVDDPDDVESCVRRLVEDAAEREALASSMADYRDAHSLDGVAERHQKLYDSLSGGPAVEP